LCYHNKKVIKYIRDPDTWVTITILHYKKVYMFFVLIENGYDK